MALQKAGSLWLAAHFELSNYRITHRFSIGTRDKIEEAHDSSIEQTYGPKYASKTDIAIGQIEFLLKYDDFNLDLLAVIFHKLKEQELQQLIDMLDKRLSEVIMCLHQNKGFSLIEEKNNLRRLLRLNLKRYNAFIQKSFLDDYCFCEIK